MAALEQPSDGVAVDAAVLRDWTAEIVCRVGTPADIATDVADVLVAADLRGVTSHGTYRLPVYAALAETGIIAVAARPRRERGTPVFDRWDAGAGWGPHAGRVLVDDVIERAGRFGVAIAVARRASHFGIAGWYAMRASARGFIGLTMSNTSPLVAPTRGRTRLMGTNPIAVAAPAGPSDLGQLFMAVDPAAIDDDGGFVERMETLCAELSSAPPAPDAPGPVLIPGQPEVEREAAQRRDGVSLDPAHHASLIELGQRLGSAFPSTVPT